MAYRIIFTKRVEDDFAGNVGFGAELQEWEPDLKDGWGEYSRVIFRTAMLCFGEPNEAAVRQKLREDLSKILARMSQDVLVCPEYIKGSSAQNKVIAKPAKKKRRDKK